MRKYEIMFIVKPTLSEDEIKKVVENFQNIITNNGGKMLNVTDMGQRELAYEIKKFKNGYYYLFELEAADDKSISEFDRLARNSQDIIRHLITKREI